MADLLRKIQNLQTLFGMIVPVPDDWLSAKQSESSGPQGMEPADCREYKAVIVAWRKALRWRQEMDDVLSVMLAVALSTDQVGDQLFLKVIGDAGGGKTRFCDALLVSKFCYPLEHLTGFHSGWKGDDGEDYSLISRINKKTLITPEGDVLMSSPRFTEIMSQQRRIFDGTSGASFKNRKEDMRYTGLRTPWIMAGTPALMDSDQSRLGDRFLRVYINSPDGDEREAILRRVGYTALRSALQTSDGKPETQLDEPMVMAYKLTGGYVNYLRENAAELLSQVDLEGHEEEIVFRCSRLAEFTAYLRARPNPDKTKEGQHDTKELPTRLTSQFSRLALCLSVVLNRDRIDEEVLRRVRKVALDTSSGITLKMARWLYEKGRDQKLRGVEPGALAKWCNYPEEKTRAMLRFLKSIGAVESVIISKPGSSRTTRYKLSSRMDYLYQYVMESDA